MTHALVKVIRNIRNAAERHSFLFILKIFISRFSVMKNILLWCFKNITQKYPGWLLILALLLCGVSVYISTGLSYDSRMDNLLPKDLPLITEFNEIVSKTGGSGPLVVVLEGLPQDKASLVISQLSQRFKKVKGVQYVDSQIPKEFLNNRQLLILPRSELIQLKLLINQGIQYARDQFTGISVGNELFNPEKLQKISKDYQFFDEVSSFHKGGKNRNYYIFIKPEGTVTDTAFTQDFVDNIKRSINESDFENEISGLKIELTGSLIVRLEENTFIKRDLEKSVLLAAFLVVSIILMYTRSWFSILLIIFPLLLSMTYTFAVTRLVIGHLNIVSGFLVAILMGLGIDYGIHLYIRFKQELLKGRSIPESSEIVATQVGRSGVISMLTTISVFSILSFSDFLGFAEFGKIATIGIVSAFFTYIFVFPAQTIFYDRIEWLGKPKPRLFVFKIYDLYANTPYFLSLGFLVILIISLFLLPRIQFEYDFQKLRGDSPAAEYETKTTEDFGFAFSPTVMLASNARDLFYVHQALDKVKASNGKDSTIGIHYSLNNFSRFEFESKKKILDSIRELFYEEKDIVRLALGGARFEKFEKMLSAKPFDESAIPESLREKFTAKDDFLLLMFSPADKNFFNVKNVYQLSKEIKEVKSILEEKNISVSILNENLLAAEIMDWVKQKGPEAMVVAMFIVLFILVLDLRSFVLALKTFLPLLTGLIFTGAIMAFFQVKLNFINIVMLPSIIGIMIGSCVYLSHHILDYSMGATVKSVQETGSAIILSALTSLAGYASLNVVHHHGVNSIATTVEIGIIVCTICALFMLPALFELNFGKGNKAQFKNRTDTNASG